MCKIYRRFYKCVEKLDNLRGTYLGDSSYVCGWDVSQITGKEEQHSRGPPGPGTDMSTGKDHCMSWIVRCGHPTTAASRTLTNQPCKAVLDEELEYLDEPCPDCSGEGHLPFTKKMKIPEPIAYPGEVGETWNAVSEAEHEVIDAYVKGTATLLGHWLASVGVSRGFAPIPEKHKNDNQTAARDRVEWAVQEATCRYDATHGARCKLVSRHPGPHVDEYYDQLARTSEAKGPGLRVGEWITGGCWEKRCHWFSSQAIWTRNEMARDILTALCQDPRDHVAVRDARDEQNLLQAQARIRVILSRTNVEGMEAGIEYLTSPAEAVQNIVMEPEEEGGPPKYRILVTVPPLSAEEYQERRMAFWQHDYDTYMAFLEHGRMAANGSMRMSSSQFFFQFLLWIVVEGDQGVTPRRLRLMRSRFSVLLDKAVAQVSQQQQQPDPEQEEVQGRVAAEDKEFVRLAEFMDCFVKGHGGNPDGAMSKLSEIMGSCVDDYISQWHQRVNDRQVEKWYRADHWTMSHFEVGTANDARSPATDQDGRCSCCWGDWKDLDIKLPVACNGCAQWKHFVCRSCVTYLSGYRENVRWPIRCTICNVQPKERVTVAQPAQMTSQQHLQMLTDEWEKVLRLERMAEATERGKMPDSEEYH